MARRKSLRTTRSGLDMSRTIFAGPASCRSIVYGYGFPSQPGKIKIGYSSRGLDRVLEQSTGFPEKPIVFFSIRHPRAKELEAAFHRTLAHAQADTVGVEWFDVSLEEVIRVSPELREAIGLKSRHAWLKRGLSVLGVGLGILLLPLVYPMAIALLGGPVDAFGFREAAEIANRYQAMLAGRRLGEAIGLVLDIVRVMRGGMYPTSAAVVALVPALVLGVLPWKLGRRQARA